MEIKSLEPGFPFSKVDISLYNLDLPVIVENMKLSPSWMNGELYSIILLNTQEKQVVLTALHKGTIITSFQKNDSLSLQIFDGEINFNTGKESVILNKGQTLTLYEHIEYSLKTRKETVLLLTIANKSLFQGEN